MWRDFGTITYTTNLRLGPTLNHCTGRQSLVNLLRYAIDLQGSDSVGRRAGWSLLLLEHDVVGYCLWLIGKLEHSREGQLLLFVFCVLRRKRRSLALEIWEQRLMHN